MKGGFAMTTATPAPTQDQMMAALGGSALLNIAFITFFVVLLMVASWRIFTKAGEAGWKSIIPVYNAYVMLKICGMKNWFWAVLCVTLVGSLITSLVPALSWVVFIELIFLVIFDIYSSIKLASVFGKGTGFAIGLIFLPNIFTLILAFGSAEYQGIEE